MSTRPAAALYPIPYGVDADGQRFIVGTVNPSPPEITVLSRLDGGVEEVVGAVFFKTVVSNTDTDLSKELPGCFSAATGSTPQRAATILLSPRVSSARLRRPRDLLCHMGTFYDRQGGLWFTRNGYYVVVSGSRSYVEKAARIIAGKL